MGGLRIHIEATGVESAERELLGVSERAYEMEPALHIIAGHMREAERELFATAGASSGEPWAALKQSTLERKAAAGYPSAILIATSDLEASLTEEGGDHIEEITHNELVFGSSDPKAHFHTTGTARMEQRKPLDFSPERIREWTLELQRYLVGVDRASFGAGAR